MGLTVMSEIDRNLSSSQSLLGADGGTAHMFRSALQSLYSVVQLKEIVTQGSLLLRNWP